MPISKNLMFERGKIILVPFPFTDLSAQKIRPAIILSKSNQSSRDVVVIFISSVVTNPAQPHQYLITTEHKAFKQTGLKVSSLAVCNKLATLDKSIVLGEIGSVPVGIMKELSRRVIAALGL